MVGSVLWCVGTLLGAWPTLGLAAERVTVTQAHLAPAASGEGMVLYAQFDFELPQTLEEAVNRGIALYFVVDFELFRGRWYWFDKKLVDQSLSFRLTYSPLTRQYRLARGALAQPFDTLTGALDALRRLSGWAVIDKGVVRPDDDPQDYRAQVRFRLDTSQLPKPFQVSALTHRDWVLASDWQALNWATAVVPSATPAP